MAEEESEQDQTLTLIPTSSPKPTEKLGLGLGFSMEDDSRANEVDSIPKVGNLVGNSEPSVDYSGFYEGELQFDFEGLEGKEEGRLVSEMIMDESKKEMIGGDDGSVMGADGGVGVGVIDETRKKFSGLLESGDDEGTRCLYDKSRGFESPERCITIFDVSDDEGVLSKVIKAEETSTSDNDMCNYEDESWGYRWRNWWPEDPYPNRYWIPHDYYGRRQMGINRWAMRPKSSEREPEPDKLLIMGKPDKPEKPAFVGAGIKNLGQTCYMNAVLQCVTHTVPFVSSLLLHEEMPECAYHPGFCTLCTVRDHIKQSLDFPCKVIFPVTLADNLEQISDTFHKYQQEDAHIFLHCLFEKLDSCWSNHQKSSTNAPEQNNDCLVNKTFGCRFISRIQCSKCGYKSDSYDPSTVVSLGVDDVDNLQGALESHTKPEKVDDYKCDGCNERVSAEKDYKLVELPSVAVFHLKRFNGDSGYFEKINKTVAYPLELDLEPYMVAADTENTETKYELYAFVVHIGTIRGGHYLSFIRSGLDSWFKFDDEDVSTIQEADALAQDAYMLFYTKKGTPWSRSLFKASENCSEKLEISSTSPTSVLCDVNDNVTASLSSGAKDSMCNDEIVRPCMGQKHVEVEMVEHGASTCDIIGVNYCDSDIIADDAKDAKQDDAKDDKQDDAMDAKQDNAMEAKQDDAMEAKQDDAMDTKQDDISRTINFDESTSAPVNTERSFIDAKINENGSSSHMEHENDYGNSTVSTSLFNFSIQDLSPKKQESNSKHKRKESAGKVGGKCKLDIRRKEACRTMMCMPSHRRALLQAAMMSSSPKKRNRVK